jgi:hypothetical protein
MATPIATPTARRLSSSASDGFSIMAGKLDAVFHQQFREAKVQSTSDGVAKVTRLRLNSAFTAPLPGRSASKSTSAAAPITQTPAAKNSTPRVVSARSSTSDFDSPDDDVSQERLDDRLIPFSSTLRGSRRLRIIDILKLSVGDKFTLVIPTQYRESKEAKLHRSSLRDILKSTIRGSLPREMSASEKADYVEYDMSLRQIEREGWVFQEYNVTVVSYAERDRLENQHLPESEVNYLLQSHLRAGLLLELDGCCNNRRGRIMLQFLAIPFIEAFVLRAPDEPVLDSRIEFPRSVKEEVNAAYLEKGLKCVKGDPVATLDLLMKSYNQQYTNTKADLAKIVKTITKAAKAARDATDDDKEKAEDDAHAVVLTAIKNETHKNNIYEFASMVDGVYKKAMEDCVDWSVATSYLLSDSDIMRIYKTFLSKRNFLWST